MDRPGIRSTEFWLALVAAVLVAAGGIYADSDLAKLGAAIGTALISAGYGFSRARVKAADLSAIAVADEQGGSW